MKPVPWSPAKAAAVAAEDSAAVAVVAAEIVVAVAAAIVAAETVAATVVAAGTKSISISKKRPGQPGRFFCARVACSLSAQPGRRCFRSADWDRVAFGQLAA